MSNDLSPDIDQHLPAVLRVVGVLLRCSIERICIVDASGCLDAPDEYPAGSTVLHRGAARPVQRLAYRDGA